VLTVKLINQSIAVEVDSQDVEPLYRHHGALSSVS
jgi:hypothetical protein